MTTFRFLITHTESGSSTSCFLFQSQEVMTVRGMLQCIMGNEESEMCQCEEVRKRGGEEKEKERKRGKERRRMRGEKEERRMREGGRRRQERGGGEQRRRRRGGKREEREGMETR